MCFDIFSDGRSGCEGWAGVDWFVNNNQVQEFGEIPLEHKALLISNHSNVARRDTDKICQPRWPLPNRVSLGEVQAPGPFHAVLLKRVLWASI
jgi:hypothetical protein